MADGPSGWGHFRQREQYLCTGKSGKFAKASAERHGGHNGVRQTPPGRTRVLLRCLGFMFHWQPLETLSDHRWSLLILEDGLAELRDGEPAAAVQEGRTQGLHWPRGQGGRDGMC